MRNVENRPTPELDAVLVWVTFTIENDLVERGALLSLRAQAAAIQHGSTSLHYMTLDSVQPVLADARARAEETSKGLKNAYNAFIRGLERAINEAKERRSIFEALDAVCTRKSECYQSWRGTKSHLTEIGITLDGPWPGEPGGNERRSKAVDAKGRVVYLTAYSRTWRGLFEASIEIPERERELAVTAAEREKQRGLAEVDLDAMPTNEDDFRMKLVEGIRRWLSFSVRTEPVESHGFTLTEEGAEDILMSCDAVVEAIFQAEVRFDEKRHRQIALKYQQQIAAADESFQHVLGKLNGIRPEIREGSAP